MAPCVLSITLCQSSQLYIDETSDIRYSFFTLSIMSLFSVVSTTWLNGEARRLQTHQLCETATVGPVDSLKCCSFKYIQFPSTYLAFIFDSNGIFLPLLNKTTS